MDPTTLARVLAVARVGCAAVGRDVARPSVQGVPAAASTSAERDRVWLRSAAGVRRRVAAAAASRESAGSTPPADSQPLQSRGAVRRVSAPPRPQASSLASPVELDDSGAGDENAELPLSPSLDGGSASSRGDFSSLSSSPRWFANAGKTHNYEVLRIDFTGLTYKQELKRRELLRCTGLPARDLRRIDPALSLTTSAPTLLVSDTVLLINLGQVRVIVAHDHALLFEPHTRVASSFLEGLLSRLSTVGVNGYSDGDDSASGLSLGQAFELEVVEAALLEVTGQLDTFLLDASARVGSLLRVLPQRLAITAEVLEELRLVKQTLVELDSRAGAIRSLLLEVLDDPEDVRGMHLALSRLSPTPEQLEDAEDEVENLLEYYLQRCETCHGEAERLLENTRDLEESISVSLSARRFEVNKLELSLSIATFATAVGALIAGIFGMNLRNKFELSTAAFYGTSAGIVLGVVILCVLLFKYTRRKRIL